MWSSLCPGESETVEKPVLVTLRASYSGGALTPAVRELHVGCICSTQPSKKVLWCHQAHMRVMAYFRDKGHTDFTILIQFNIVIILFNNFFNYYYIAIDRFFIFSQSAEFYWDNVASIQQLGFTVEPSKGVVNPGHKCTVTVTWSPQSGYTVRKRCSLSMRNCLHEPVLIQTCVHWELMNS